jgi:hypothetical protein
MMLFKLLFTRNAGLLPYEPHHRHGNLLRLLLRKSLISYREELLQRKPERI